MDILAYEVKRYPDELVRHIEGHGRPRVLFKSSRPWSFPATVSPSVGGMGRCDEPRDLFLGAMPGGSSGPGSGP